MSVWMLPGTCRGEADLEFGFERFKGPPDTKRKRAMPDTHGHNQDRKLLSKRASGFGNSGLITAWFGLITSHTLSDIFSSMLRLALSLLSFDRPLPRYNAAGHSAERPCPPELSNHRGHDSLRAPAGPVSDSMHACMHACMRAHGVRMMSELQDKF